MTTEREIEEAAARCVSIAVFRHNSPKTRHAGQSFEDDVRSVARWAEAAGLSEQEADRRLLEPLQSELAVRYGIEVGSRLRDDFVSALRGPGRAARPGRPAPGRSRSADRSPSRAGAALD